MQDRLPAERHSGWWKYLPLGIPFVAMLWVPFYASASPEIGGIPFFYWYQFVWVLVSALLTAIVYLATKGADARAKGRTGDGARRLRRG